jgi:hypothetical protein
MHVEDFMRRSSLGLAFGSASLFILGLAFVPACSGANSSAFGGMDGGSSSGATTSGSGASISGLLGNNSSGGSLGGSSAGQTTVSSGGTTTETVCPAGVTCNVACPNGGTTTITGKVYDPAGKDPLYGVEVYVPAMPLTPLPRGVPTPLADACSCGALYPSGAVVATSTDVNGNFTLTNAPVGSSVPLVLQVGKWRRSLKINVTSCGANAQPMGSLTLPSTVPAGDTDDNMPDIAVSTGSADSLECLLRRIGVAASEYVPGASTAGHVHIFSGGDGSGGGFGGGHGFGGGGGMVGSPEATVMAGAPTSFDPNKGLWASQAQLMPYDVVLLSCEGGETYKANPPALEAYLNAGGRAFASHFHYAWFSGPLDSAGTNTYAANPDWNNLATWAADGTAGGGGGHGGGGGGLTGGAPIGGIIDLKLNVSGQPFAKGATLDTWLDENGAIGIGGVGGTELPIYQPRYNALVGPSNTPSQPWITADPGVGEKESTMYFSFDTPINGTTLPGATAPQYCGRAVFSGLHVAGDTTPPLKADNSSLPPPQSCANQDLSPQEKALEFMLFDLSACVVPDTITVSQDAGLPPPPPNIK